MPDEDGHVVERREDEVEVVVEGDDEPLHCGLELARSDVVPDLQRTVVLGGQAVAHVLGDVVDLSGQVEGTKVSSVSYR